MRSPADLQSIHRFSSGHRAQLAASQQAGCFYCLALFPPAEIRDWVDGGAKAGAASDAGVTALCPRCGIDAVLPSAAVSLDAELLSALRRFWF